MSEESRARNSFLAHHDTLTGLANRNTFNHKLDDLIEAYTTTGPDGGSCLAVLCLDLDRFKEVNDLFGHAAGDQLLQTVGRCTTKVLRNGQMMARLGGDEVAILAPGLSDPTQAGRIAENVARGLADGESELSDGIRIDIDQHRHRDIPSRRRRSYFADEPCDTALYRAKAEGRGTYRFFEPAMGEQVRDRRLIETRLAICDLATRAFAGISASGEHAEQEIVGLGVVAVDKSPARSFRPPCSFRSRKSAASSCRSASGCCAKLAGKPRDGRTR